MTEELQRLRTQAIEGCRAEQLLTLRLTNKQQQLQEANVIVFHHYSKFLISKGGFDGYLHI